VSNKTFFNLSGLLGLTAVLLIAGFSPATAFSDTNETANNAQDVEVPEANDLKALGEQSRQSKLPIILVFSAENCSHCERLEEDVLRPMVFTGELNNHGLLRKYNIDSADAIRDFDGNNRDAEKFSSSRHVDVTPTVQIVDASGKEIVPAIVGYQTPDFYLAYFMKAIEVSEQILRERK